MAPMVHGLEAQYAGQIDFYFLDADDPATAGFQKQLGFQFQPYFVLIDSSGGVITRWAGSVSREAFEAEFAKLLQ